MDTSKIQSKLIPITHLPYTPHGYACGYVGVPPEHPWFEKDYDSIDVEVHGGLTWGDKYLPNTKPDGLWWLGFDTAHYNDNIHNCSKEYCEHELQSLLEQAIKAAV